MKFLIILASVVLTINAASDRELWQEFKAKHGKTYRSLLEEQARYGIFQSNLRKIEQHNELYERKEKSYTLGVNQFADLTKEEFKNTILSLKPETTKAAEAFTAFEDSAAPSSINWVTKGAVTEIKNQGSSGSSWAFSAVGAIESAYFLSSDSLVSLSEQYIVDCFTGSDGGSIEAAFDFVRDHGIPKDSDYPNAAGDQSCQDTPILTKIQKYVSVKQSEGSLLEAVGTVGPVAVAIEADHFQFYSSGVFDDPSCTHELDHGVVVVGYDSQDGLDYWLVKNSWGAGWGEEGYVKMVRNHDNQCGIADDASYPVL